MVGAIKPLFLGRVLRDLAFVPEYDLLFFFERQRGDTSHGAALLSLHPTYARLMPLERRYRALEFRESPFVSALRRALAGARLEELSARSGDRAIDMRFSQCCGEEALDLDVHFELYGPHSNAFLCTSRGIVRNILFPDRRRALQLPPGATYVEAPLSANVERNASETFSPPGFQILAWTEQYLHVPAERDRMEHLRAQIARELERRTQKAERRLAGLQTQVEAAERAGDLTRHADLLKASAHELKRGASEAFVIDWYGDPEVRVRIALDPRLGPHENAEKLYKKSRRMTAAKEVAASELARGTRELLALRQAAEHLATLDDPAAILACGDQWRSAGLLPQAISKHATRTKEPQQSLPYRRFQSADGLEIRVGRNARGNDRLSFVLSKGNDYWVHSALGAGSHVVVPLARDQQIPIETLHDAACLALHFSASKALGGEVHIARVKQLRRLKGAAPGQVAIQTPKTLRLRPEPARLQRLLRGARENEESPGSIPSY